MWKTIGKWIVKVLSEAAAAKLAEGIASRTKKD